MKIFKLEDMYRGWFIGNFDPSVYKQPFFEVGILTHKKDEYWPKHMHKIGTEYNVLLEGIMTINGHVLNKNDIFIIEPNESSQPIFITDCKVLVIKVPSVPGDKYEII